MTSLSEQMVFFAGPVIAGALSGVPHRKRGGLQTLSQNKTTLICRKMGPATCGALVAIAGHRRGVAHQVGSKLFQGLDAPDHMETCQEQGAGERRNLHPYERATYSFVSS